LPVGIIRFSPAEGWIKWIFSRFFRRGLAPDIRTSRELVAAMTAEATREAIRYGRLSAAWGTLHITLGLPSAVLGAVAGATVLASPKWIVPAAVMAIIASALTAGMIFLGGEGRQRRAQKLHDAWNAFEADCLLALISINDGNKDTEEVGDLTKRLIASRRDIISGGSE
jgi:hypothetical protein